MTLCSLTYLSLAVIYLIINSTFFSPHLINGFISWNVAHQIVHVFCSVCLKCWPHYPGVLYIPCANLVVLWEGRELREYYFVICEKNSACLGIGNGYEGQNSWIVFHEWKFVWEWLFSILKFWQEKVIRRFFQ